MLLALSTEDGLLELLGVLYDVGGILGGCLVEDFAELLLVLLVHCLDGGAVLGLRIYDGLIDDFLSGSAECLVGLYCLQLNGAANVAGHHLADFLSLLAGYGEDLGYALLVAVLRVDEVHALSQLA